jgi:xanthine dehydrogenase YagS FAD-binding subunit
MEPFRFVRAADDVAFHTAAAESGARLIAGGTTLVDLMRLEIEKPTTLVDITQLPLTQIGATGGNLMIGALVRNSDVAWHETVRARYAVLSEALLSGASPQLRNMATVGGNLMQRTRCPYFRDPAQRCNKRDPGAGCAAIGGFTRSHAVLGTSEACIATNPSDQNVALVALDAIVHLRSAVGAERTVAVTDFHTLPGTHPEVETVLAHGELITAVELPASAPKRSHYVKVRDRASYAFALASAAVGFDLDGTAIRNPRIALGGVGTKPWRARDAEQVLNGKQLGDTTAYAAAAEVALAGAVPRGDNAFKILLAKRTIIRALTELAGAA